MITVPLYKSTIPHQIKMKFKAGKIFLNPLQREQGSRLEVWRVPYLIWPAFTMPPEK